jgi:hypothetical protein
MLQKTGIKNFIVTSSAFKHAMIDWKAVSSVTAISMLMMNFQRNTFNMSLPPLVHQLNLNPTQVVVFLGSSMV